MCRVDWPCHTTSAKYVEAWLNAAARMRASWAQARASADLLGSARGQYYPTINGAATVSRIQSPATGTRPAGTRTEYGPSLNLSYLLADFGGRSGSIERARQTLFAASLSHNATLQNTVLQAEGAYFTYMATVALLGAEQSAIAQARASLTAAQSRFKRPIVTQIETAPAFWRAEEYHQQYLEKRGVTHCHI